MSLIDKAFRRTVAFDFFKKGWGHPNVLLQLVDNMIRVREEPGYIRDSITSRPVMIEKRNEYKKLIELEGSFVSPMEDLIPGTMCSKNRIGRFQMVIPKKWKSEHRPVCFHFAGTGDHSFYRRRVFLANQLLDDGIASVILMNPFYGTRMPVDQKGSGLNFLSDLFVMGGALILESHTLLNWCQKHGYGPFAFHGVSMGGYMATICATTVSHPLSLIPCLSWTSASVVFLEGVLSQSVDWLTLSEQYLRESAYSRVIRPKIQPPIKSCYVVKRSPADSKECPVATPAPSQPSGLSPPSAISSPERGPPTSQYPVPDGFYDIFNFSRHPFTDISKLWAYTKSHNRMHLFVDNEIFENALSVVKSVPVSAVFGDKPKVDPEVREFMREMLDFFTHLGNFSSVADPRLIISVTAGNDAYVPREGVVPLDVVFPKSDIRYLPQSGHVGTYIRNAIWNQDFRQAVCDSLNRQMIYHYGVKCPIYGKIPKSVVA